MTRSWIRSIVVSCIVIMLIGLIAVSMSSRSIEFEGIPVVFLCAFIAIGIQWIVFIPSYIAQTEHYFDLSGTITYLSLTGFIFFTLNEIGSVDTRTLIIGILVGVWALRLGTFLRFTATAVINRLSASVGVVSIAVAPRRRAGAGVG